MTVLDKLEPKEHKTFLLHAQGSHAKPNSVLSYKHSYAYSTTSVTVDTY
jgi:hypothetical protein